MTELVELKNCYGFLYLRSSRILSISPADVRQSENKVSSLAPGSNVTVDGAGDFFVFQSPMEVAGLVQEVEL